jgi:hypothetical protein
MLRLRGQGHVRKKGARVRVKSRGNKGRIGTSMGGAITKKAKQQKRRDAKLAPGTTTTVKKMTDDDYARVFGK